MAELYFRPHTWDRDVWRSVAEKDEYSLGALRFSHRDLILDIGAHIGAFTYLALDRGAGFVLAVEPDPQNFHLLQHNVHQACGATDRAILISAACWRSDREGVGRPVHYVGVGNNTGGGNTLGSDGVPTAALALDDLIALGLAWSGANRVRLLKLDCEGAEWAILGTATRLVEVDAIVGEYHELTDPAGWGLPPGVPHERHGLTALLRSLGYEVRHADEPGIGRFAAWRQDCEPRA